MKPWAYLAIITIIVAAFGGTYKIAHSSGYDKRDQEVQQDIIAAQESARLAEETKWKETVAAAKGVVVIEEKIVEKIRVVNKEVPKVVREIVEVKPECSDLGPNYARLRNNQVRAANSIQDAEVGLSAN